VKFRRALAIFLEIPMSLMQKLFDRLFADEKTSAAGCQRFGLDITASAG